MTDTQGGPCAEACIYGTEGEFPELCGTLTVKARKPAKCCECGSVIQPGDVYEVTSGKWDGEWLSFKTCAPCAEIRQAFCCDGWVYGTLWQDAAEGFFETMTTGCFDKLTTAAAKEKLRDMWMHWKGFDE